MLLEKAVQDFVEDFKPQDIEFHPREEFVIIPKKNNILFPVELNTIISGKRIVVVQDSVAEQKTINNQPEDFSWENFKIYGLEANMSAYIFPTGEIEYRILGDDMKHSGAVYLWGFFGWIKIADP